MSSFIHKAVASALLLSFTLTASAQTSTGSSTATKKKSTSTRARSTTPSSTAKASTGVTAEDVRALRQMLEQQQQQIEQLRQQLNQRDEQTRAAQQAADQARQTAETAAQKAEAAQTATATDKDAFTQMQSDVADLKTNVGNVAINAQDVDKRVAAAEGIMNRFRFNGDLRVRGEAFIQDTPGCTAACNDRFRARIRARFGFDGKLGDNFIGGIALATGAVVNGAPDFKDPVSTNETLTSFYERKTIGLDRGYITWQPQRWKWITATGGKFAASWQKTVVTFDNDLNPEGFTIKLSKDLSTPWLKNVTVQPVVLMYNEVSGGPDSNAVGGQILTRWQLGKYVTLTPSYMVLNWNGSDAIAQAANPVTLPNPNTTAVGTPTATPTTQPIRIINANAFTNASVIIGTGAAQRRGFVSDFEYSDAVVNMAIKTRWARFPVNLIGEYIDNLRARNNQGQAGFGEFSIGQTRNKNDIQGGYSFARIEQDAVISQFNESDYRAATNVVQHRFFFNWAIAPSVTASYTMFIGRTLNTNLQNAARLSNIAVGQQEPFLKRMQLDLVYRF
jgi:hypothetical protein